MSTTVGIAGFSIKLNDNQQNEKSLMKISEKIGYSWNDMYEWEEILYDNEKYLNTWKPHMDVNGDYGLIFLTHYEYDAHDIEIYISLLDMKNAYSNIKYLCNLYFENELKSFTLLYYNGSDCPFKF